MAKILSVAPPGITCLEKKEITDAEGIYSKLDAIGLDKLDRLMGGDCDDIICNDTNYFLEFFKGFIKCIP